MAKQGIKIKGGAVDYGRIYEQRIAAHLAIRSALDPSISDFWLVSNIDDVGAFDDIVLMLQDREGNKKLFCIQLKHLESKGLQAIQLEHDAKDSKFGLRKYQTSFETIEKNMGQNVDILDGVSLDNIYLILWTNGPFTGTDKLQNISVNNVSDLNFLDISSKPNNVYKVNNLPTSNAPFKVKFLNRFYLFADQANATVLDKLIKDELASHLKSISNSVIISITDYFAKWSLGDKRTIRRINKIEVQTMLMEFLFFPYLVNPSKTENSDCEKYDLINKTLTSFNIIPISEIKLTENVSKSNKLMLSKLYQSRLNLDLPWNTDLTDNHWSTIRVAEDEANQKIWKVLRDKKIFVPYLTIKDLYLAAWQCRLIPLIVDCSIFESFVEEILVTFKDVTKDLSFVLLNPILEMFKSGNFKTFHNISNIDDVYLRNNNLYESYISLQGKRQINLETLKENNGVLEELTPNVYLTLMEGVVDLGEYIEVENYYIKRDLRRPMLKPSVLDENGIFKDRSYMFNKHGDLFILVEFHGTLPLKYSNKSCELTTYLQDEDCQEDEKIYILTTNLHDVDQFVIVAAAQLYRDTKKSVHILKLKSGYLEWSFSKGIVETLQNHLIESSLLKDENSEHNIPEDDILDRLKSRLNIISNNAGMGKTFMLKSMANKFQSDEWVCYINLSDFIGKIPDDKKLISFINYLLDQFVKTREGYLQNFGRQILIHCIRALKMVCLFDGYDEVSSEHTLSFLKELKNANFNMWITTRPTYKKELEMHMQNLSIEITHFSTEDHVTFLWKYFHTYDYIYHYDDDQIQYVINTINKCSSNLDKTLIALPLQTRMFAEIFGDDIHQINEKEKLTMVDLYNKFVDVKLKEYKSYEATSLKKTLSKLALKLFFTEELLENLLDFEDLDEEAVTFRESYKKDSIVIGLDEKGDAVFGHRSFAEFLTAYWLAKQIVNRKGEYNVSWIPVLEKLYYIEMTPVRVFFDRILSQNLPLHLAILNNDMENVQTLIKESHGNQDVLGRSSLHLAVTYGNYCDLYVAKEIKGLRNVGLHSLISQSKNSYKLRIPLLEEKQYRIRDEIVETLLNQGLTNTRDKLFRYDLFDYAMKSCSLNFVHCLYKRFEKTALHFEYGYCFQIFLYFIVYLNLYNILSKRRKYNFNTTKESMDELRDTFKGFNSKLLTVKYNDMYLTELAALKGSKEILFDLLQSGLLKVEQGDVMHKACFGGHSEVLELLYKMGADINKLDESNWSPLYHAAVRGRSDITYLLLLSKKFLSNNTKSINSMTPLHYAAQGGHLACVSTLLDMGAKVNTKDEYGNTPLLYACIYGHSDIIDVILKSGVIDISDDTVKSAINVAAFHGYNDCVKILLAYGLNANNLDENGNSPLVIASKKGFSNVVSELATSGSCDFNLKVSSETLSSLQMWCAGNYHILLHTKLFHIKCDRNKAAGITAMHFAARHGHTDCIKTLLDLGADPLIEDDVTKCTPLVWACMYGFPHILKMLLVEESKRNSVKSRTDAELGLLWSSMLGYEKCVEVICHFLGECDTESEPNEEGKQSIKDLVSQEFGIDVWFFGENENMPLVLAAKNGCASVIRTLVTLNYRNNQSVGEALHWAARTGHLDCVKELIAAGADEMKKNAKHLCLLPISWASMYGRTDIVEYFLKGKTSDCLKNEDMQIAVNWAATGGHYDCLKMLLDFGFDADSYYANLYGTAIVNACEYRGTIEVIDLLMERNCKLNVRNVDGFSPLDFAARRKSFEIVKRLILSGAFDNLKVGENTDLFKNLQSALDWALKEEHPELVTKLVELGISPTQN